MKAKLDNNSTFEMEENGLSVFAKWDGCIDIFRDYGDGGSNAKDYIHLCGGVDELIQLLLKAKDEAKRRGWGDDWDDNNAEDID